MRAHQGVVVIWYSGLWAAGLQILLSITQSFEKDCERALDNDTHVMHYRQFPQEDGIGCGSWRADISKEGCESNDLYLWGVESC